MKIAIYSLFRDSEKTLPNFLSILDKLNEKFDCTFFFYENDSVDNTKKILHEWSKCCKAFLFSETHHYQKYGSVISSDRFIKLGMYRNTLLQKSLLYNKTEYSLFIDSDIESFTEENAAMLAEAIEITHGSLVTAATMQDIPCKMGSDKKYSYYDSLPLYDIEGNHCLTWSWNPFVRKEDRNTYNSLLPVEVQSAFGSCALAKTSLVKNPNFKWGTNGVCEHLFLCENIIQYGGIYVCPNINPIMHIEQKKFPNEELVIDYQKKMLALMEFLN